MPKQKIDDFTQAYIECALWSSNDESDESGGSPLEDNYSIEDIAPETLQSMIEDCRGFQEEASEELAASGLDDQRAGHDFWLTRNRHGAGFWDEGIGQVGKTLTDMAHAYGECNLYVGDDGQIHGG